MIPEPCPDCGASDVAPGGWVVMHEYGCIGVLRDYLACGAIQQRQPTSHSKGIGGENS